MRLERALAYHRMIYRSGGAEEEMAAVALPDNRVAFRGEERQDAALFSPMERTAVSGPERVAETVMGREAAGEAVSAGAAAASVVSEVAYPGVREREEAASREPAEEVVRRLSWNSRLFAQDMNGEEW